MDFAGKVVKKIKALSGNWKLRCFDIPAFQQHPEIKISNKYVI